MNNNEKILTLRIPSQLYREISKLVEKGKFVNTSEAIREAIRILIIFYNSDNNNELIKKLVSIESRLKNLEEKLSGVK